MGTKILILFVLLLFLCFCVYNWWFLKENNRRIPKSQRSKVPLLRNHTLWGVASLASLFAILGIMGVALYDLIVNIMKMKN